MTLYDWILLDLAARGQKLDWFKGSTNLTFGDVLNSTCGASLDYAFGPDVELKCDPTSFLSGFFGKFAPITSTLVNGVSGQVGLGIGPAFQADYLGPHVNVQRGPSPKTKNSKHWFGLIKKKVPGSADGEEEDTIDIATSAAAGSLVILIVATAVLAHVALQCHYFLNQKPDPDSKSADSTPEGFAKTAHIYKLLNFTIASRLMALLKTLEAKGSCADFGKHYLKVGRTLVKIVRTIRDGDLDAAQLGAGELSVDEAIDSAAGAKQG